MRDLNYLPETVTTLPKCTNLLHYAQKLVCKVAHLPETAIGLCKVCTV